MLLNNKLGGRKTYENKRNKRNSAGEKSYRKQEFHTLSTRKEYAIILDGVEIWHLECGYMP